jgi:hypothetical protein
MHDIISNERKCSKNPIGSNIKQNIFIRSFIKKLLPRKYNGNKIAEE